jgi:Questin oxidase-like
MSVRPSTRERIEAAHRYGAFYRGYLASHYPMAVVALEAMGGTDADVDRFGSHYLQQLELLDDAIVTIEPGDEAAHLGSPRAFPEWVLYFSKAIASDGVDATLGRWINRLLPAIASGAFHGAIRTAYALESGCERELAHALAYWAAAYEPFAPPPEPSGSLAPGEVFASIARDPEHAGRRLPGRNIIERTVKAMDLPDFASRVASVDPARLDLDSVARALLQAYVASGDFTVLHCVTATHGFRLLAPHVHEPEAALRHLWSATIATYLGAGSPRVEGWGIHGNEALAWPVIHERAVRCEDEHDIKFAYTCWREWQHRGDDLYRRAASARVCNVSRVAEPAALC